jgi:hypothetical protein
MEYPSSRSAYGNYSMPWRGPTSSAGPQEWLSEYANSGRDRGRHVADHARSFGRAPCWDLPCCLGAESGAGSDTPHELGRPCRVRRARADSTAIHTPILLFGNRSITPCEAGGPRMDVRHHGHAVIVGRSQSGSGSTTGWSRIALDERSGWRREGRDSTVHVGSGAVVAARGVSFADFLGVRQ